MFVSSQSIAFMFEGFQSKKHEPAKPWKIQRTEAGKRGQNIVCFYFFILHLAIDSIKELLLGEGDREEFRQLAGVTLQNVCSFALPFFRKLNWVMPTFTVLQKYALHIMHKNVFLMRIFFLQMFSLIIVCLDYCKRKPVVSVFFLTVIWLR